MALVLLYRKLYDGNYSLHLVSASRRVSKDSFKGANWDLVSSPIELDHGRAEADALMATLSALWVASKTADTETLKALINNELHLAGYTGPNGTSLASAPPPLTFLSSVGSMSSGGVGTLSMATALIGTPGTMASEGSGDLRVLNILQGVGSMSSGGSGDLTVTASGTGVYSDTYSDTY